MTHLSNFRASSVRRCESTVRVAASYEVHVEDECEVEFGSPGQTSPPRPRETTQVRPTPAFFFLSQYFRKK